MDRADQPSRTRSGATYGASGTRSTPLHAGSAAAAAHPSAVVCADPAAPLPGADSAKAGISAASVSLNPLPFYLMDRHNEDSGSMGRCLFNGQPSGLSLN